MDINLAALPDDVETLQRMVRSLAAERAALSEAQVEIERLRLIIQKLQRRQFGRRAERLEDDQLQLGFEDLETDLARAEARLPSSAGKRPRSKPPVDRPSLPAHLPREDMRLDIEHQACPCCGGKLHVIGDTVSETLDYVPARLRVIRIRRPRYGCRACGTIHQVPAPERPIAKGLATPQVLRGASGDRLTCRGRGAQTHRRALCNRGNHPRPISRCATSYAAHQVDAVGRGHEYLARYGT
jgi:hypothetical protein